MMGRGPWLVVVIACKTRFPLIDDPDDYIRIAHANCPDEKLKRYLPFLEAVRIGELSHAYLWGIRMVVVRMMMRATCHSTFLLQSFVWYVYFAVAAPFVAFVGSLVLVSDLCGLCLGKSLTTACLAFVGVLGFFESFFLTALARRGRGKAIDKLDAKEFRERFCIPNGVAIELLNGRVLVPSEKAEEKTMIFSKETIQRGAPVPSAGVVQGFLHFTQIPPVFIHPNIVRVADGMQHHKTCCTISTSRC
ncbi:hypothetical protein CK203_104093 [Vitis vinifera]|uniref:Uncharacterized protein n=1 Tax=Vitis vinifera TaxID=29760 RepID=A0A438EQN9_VITVI|nr:hypothetical protein CK203_104093 [Vitis vinifera]